MEAPNAAASTPATSFQPLTLLGDAGAACEGDFCEIPAPREQSVVNELLDSGTI